MSETFDLSKELDDISVLRVRDKLDYGELVRQQISRCEMSETIKKEQPEVSIGHVKKLLSLIVLDHRDDEFLKELKDCSETKLVPKPQYWAGVVITPIKYVKEKITDWDKVYDLCLAKFNRMGTLAQPKPTAIIGVKK